MHPAKIMNELEFIDIDFPGLITPQIRETMKDIHPTQFLNSSINMKLIKVSYSYITKRNNYRESAKYILVQLMHEDIESEIEMRMEDWVEKYNKQYPFKAISNVKILDISTIANANLKLQ